MELIVIVHNHKYYNNLTSSGTIFTKKDMPEYISIDCDKLMERVTLQYKRVIVFLKDIPARIDYDVYCQTVNIITKEQDEYLRKPYTLYPEKHQGINLWTYGEREETTIEETGMVSMSL